MARSIEPGSPTRRGAERPTSWWLERLRRRAQSMGETLDLSEPIPFADEAERDAAIRFFNAAYRAEESGLRQAHELAAEMAAIDPELAEALKLYGDEEGWHRTLLTEFLAHIGGEVREMGFVTRTFYRLYARAERMETIMLTNLMFETIGSTTYRLALRHAEHRAVRQMLTILTRDEAFHVPLNVHFMKTIILARPASKLRMKIVYNLLFVALVASTAASRRRAQRFDHIPLAVLARAYAVSLAGLFLHEGELQLKPPLWLLRLLRVSKAEIENLGREAATSVEAAIAAADRERVAVTAL
jgi:hypothetical protein